MWTLLVAILIAVCVPSAVCTPTNAVVTPVPVVLALTVSIDLYVLDISLPLKSVILNLKGLSREFTKTVEEVTEFSEIKDIKKEILDTKDVITKEGKELDNFIDKNNKDILELEKDD